MVKDKQLVLSAVFVRKLYKILFRYYGPQGWWPLRSRRINQGVNIGNTLGFNSGGYHPEFIHELSSGEVFEIAVGAILTQNTNWNNAASALDQMILRNILSPKKIMNIEQGELAQLIRSSGYYNQKAAKLKAFANLFINNMKPTRPELLSLKGIGPETADAIMLYAFNQPYFVVDTYTRRIFSRVFGMNEINTIDYNALRESVEDVFYDDVYSRQEFHALLVIHAKKYCLKNIECGSCPISGICKKIK